ncbi:MAG: PAS domain S-box protein [Peptococcaceae bacterium]|nr:PAS domain S-box protein [Peptococcaceae bacterium]
MKLRIFRNMVILSFSVMGLFLAGLALLWWSECLTTDYVILVWLALLAFAVVLAYYQTCAIVRPIEQMTPEKPLFQIGYKELYPIAEHVQNMQEQVQETMTKLEEKQLEFNTLADNMSEGIVILNDQGYILSINKQAMRIFGLQHGENYENQHILMANRNRELLKLVDHSLAGQNQDLILELDGRIYQVMCNAIGKAGVTQGLVLFLLDITEKQQQEQLRREFTANVSHELRTPLTAISGYAEIMMHGLVSEENVQPFAEKIYKEANRLITLIGDIIQLSQLDESTGQFRWEQVDLAQLAEEVVLRLQSKAEQQNIVFSCYTEPTVVVGIASVLQEIVYNLCDNAIKYNKPNGNVKLSVVQSGINAIIKVVDTGIGISQEDQPRIFERFYRADKSHSRLIGGTGLGLSIVKHGVQLHNGDVELESTLGAGTVITVRIPITR